MANPWDNDPIIDVRRDERERAETRYRNLTGDTNPLAQPVILPGEEGYSGEGEYLPQADVVVRRDEQPWANDPTIEVLNSLQSDPLSAFSSAAVEQYPWGDEAAALLSSRLQGVPYEAMRDVQGLLADKDREEHPLARRLGGIAGFAASMAVPGAAFIRGAPLAAGASQAAIRSAQRAAAGRAGAVGAATGLAYGSGAAEDGVENRLVGGGVGALAGGTGGYAIQRAAPAVSGAIGSIADRLRSIVNPGGIRARGNVTPEMAAATRLEPYITPEALAERQRLRDLGVDASVVDTISGTGERQIRAAAGLAGPGSEIAVTNAARRQASLKPEVIADTRRLSPTQETATQYTERLINERDALADSVYPEAYAATVQVGEDVLSALADDPGRAALRRARAAAVARRNDQQVAEIDALLSGETSEVSAGTLDRVRIAMRNRGRAMQQRADTQDIASGLFGREADIDAALSGVEQLAPARAAYRTASQAVDAVTNAPDITTTPPADYAAWMSTATPEVREAAIVGAVQRISDTLGRQASAGSRSIDNISQANYARQNLEALLGPEEAARYLDQIAARVQVAQRAQRISPNTNSQTFGRAADTESFRMAEAVGAGSDVIRGAVGGDVGAIARTIDRVRARATTTPEEREAIVRLGLGSADQFERIVRLAEEARAAGRRPPREVRAWVTGISNQLGARSPVVLELEQRLLPNLATSRERETQP